MIQVCMCVLFKCMLLEMLIFRLFDWLTAPPGLVDLACGYFLLFVHPTQKNALDGVKGRLVTQSLKNIKSNLKTILVQMLKRTELDITQRDLFPFTASCYDIKMNKYKNSQPLRPEGTQQRQSYTPDDLVLRDRWLLQHDPDNVDPNVLNLVCISYVFDQLACRGPSFIELMYRNMISFGENEQGKFVRVHGNLKDKTDGNAGRSKKFAPVDQKIHGDREVAMFRKLLEVLPKPGCDVCKGEQARRLAPKCWCDGLWLRPRTDKTWRRSDPVWFDKIKWKRGKLETINPTVSNEAGLSAVYKNGAARCSFSTVAAKAGFTAEESGDKTGHRDPKEQAKYIRNWNKSDPREARLMGMAASASGRQQLINPQSGRYGVMKTDSDHPTKAMYENFRALRDGRPMTSQAEPQVMPFCNMCCHTYHRRPSLAPVKCQVPTTMEVSQELQELLGARAASWSSLPISLDLQEGRGGCQV